MFESIRFDELFAVPLRNGVSYASALRGSGIPMVNMREIFAYDRIADQECELAPLTSRERESSLLADGDLLFARQSLTFAGAGKCVLVLPSDNDRTWESHLIRVRLDMLTSCSAFYYYYFKSSAGRRGIETIIQQVAAAGIRGSDLARLQVPLLPLSQQRAIAEVLGALDDKIAANTRLAQIADDYVRAQYEEVERTSKESIAVSKLATARRDTVDPGSTISGTLYVGLEHIPRRSMWLGDSGYAVDVTSQKSRFERDDILFGKLRPYFHKVVAAPHAGVSSTDILVLTATIADLNGFVLAALASDSVVTSVTAMSEGTRMPRTSWKDLSSVEVPWPGEARAKEFSAEVIVLRSAVEGLLEENKTLAATRDALLPQLMSGKLRVCDAEIAVEAVV